MSPQSSISQSLTRQLFFKSILVLVSLVLMAGGAWFIFTEEQAAFQKVENEKVRNLDGLIGQVNFLRSQVRLYEQYGAKYKDLVRKGVVKKQDRVFWVDSMVQMKQSLVMPEFNFGFTPESTLTSQQFNRIKINKPIFFFSRLNLKTELQHEADLLTFLDAVNTRVSPLYLVESCKTEMKVKDLVKTSDLSFNPDKGNIKADCSFIVFHSHANIAI